MPHTSANTLGKYSYISNLLRNNPVPVPLVKILIAATSAVLAKIENAPDYTTVMRALTAIQDDMKTTATTLQQTAIASQQIINICQDTNTITKEAAVAGIAYAFTFPK